MRGFSTNQPIMTVAGKVSLFHNVVLVGMNGASLQALQKIRNFRIWDQGTDKHRNTFLHNKRDAH